MRLETTFEGAGVLGGDLTPECAAVVGAVLDALSAPAGAEDTRSQAQRYHDGLQEAMRRLVAAGLLPERAGQPVKAWVHISLADLLLLDGSSALQEEWTAGVRAQWAAHRAAASAGGGSDGGAWLDGDAAAAMACDAAMAPIVTGEVNPAVLEDLIRLCVQLDKLRYPDPGGLGTGSDTGDPGDPGSDPGSPGGDPGTGSGSGPRRRPRHRRPGRPRLRHHAGVGGAGAGGDRQGGRFAVGSGRAGGVLAPPPARRPARGAEPAAGHRDERVDPGLDPQRGDLAGSALPVGGPVQPARQSACEVHHVGTRRTAARPAPKTASCCVSTTTRSSSTGGAGPWS